MQLRKIVRIPTGACGLSEPVDINVQGYRLAAIQVPRTWTAANLTFRASATRPPKVTQVVPTGTVAGLAPDANPYDIQMTNPVSLQHYGAEYAPAKVDPVDISALLSAAATISMAERLLLNGQIVGGRTLTRILALLMALMMADPAFATGSNRTPLVLGSAGAQQQLQSGDVLTDKAGNPFGLQHGSVTAGDCVQWYANGVLSDAGSACGSGGGDGAVHSRVVACQGFWSTFFPKKMLQKKLRMNGICARPKNHALIEIKTFSGCMGWACAYCTGSYRRRETPARPRMNIGIKIQLIKMNEKRKWIFPSTSFILRPVTFGNQ